jgi:hypothetical protein
VVGCGGGMWWWDVVGCGGMWWDVVGCVLLCGYADAGAMCKMLARYIVVMRVILASIVFTIKVKDTIYNVLHLAASPK